MTSYNFTLNPRLPLGIPTSVNTSMTPGTRMATTIMRTPQPSAVGSMMALHPLIDPRTMMLNPQGFSVPASHIMNDCVFPSANMMPPLQPHNLNDTSLDLNNILRQKSIDEAMLKEGMKNSDSQENHYSALIAAESRIEQHQASNSDNSMHKIRLNESIGNLPQIIPTSTSININQNVPANMWNNLLSNAMNYPIGVNRIIQSNLLDQNLIISPNAMGVFNSNASSLSIPKNEKSVSEIDSSLTSSKSLIQHTNCTLFPPSVNAPSPTTRDRPPGCKTVFVGGLSENVKEELIREIFEFCGEILHVRLSNKKFCHIRFAEEMSVDRALTLSGYRMRLAYAADSTAGRLHVDFAHARDDQYEYECKQRQLQREQRHKERLLREHSHELSPPGLTHFTESEANGVLEKIKGEDSFIKAVSIAVCWLDRGECNKRNVNTFYGIIQSVNSHVRRLLNEKCQCEIEFNKAKEQLKGKALTILTQFAQIEKIFVSSSHKKVWDHFSKAQRKNIEIWKRAAMEIKNLPPEACETMNDEMEVSDSDSEESTPHKKQKLHVDETNSLNDENDSLRCQLEAYKNEIGVVKSELQSELKRKNEQIAILQEALNNFNGTVGRLKLKSISELNKQDEDIQSNSLEADTTLASSSNSTSQNSLSEKDAKLIGLISIFLHVHPFGAGVEYICSFLNKTEYCIRVADVELLMNQFPTIFQQEVIGIGANMERKWKYCGFITDNKESQVKFE